MIHFIQLFDIYPNKRKVYYGKKKNKTNKTINFKISQNPKHIAKSVNKIKITGETVGDPCQSIRLQVKKAFLASVLCRNTRVLLTLDYYISDHEEYPLEIVYLLFKFVSK